ncbi:MAG TPA: hypothetical protein VGY53_01145, partial [Isosphaeraceae bacterium]|nr:hypothetical protein [Isosphaeraceae bacterium]
MPTKRPRLVRIVRIWWRRRLTRLERSTPGWLMLIITPWGTSLALHAVMLVLLAIYFYAYIGRQHSSSGSDIQTALFANQLADDVTSLTPADQSGDPFTHLQSPEPPSLSFDPVTADVTKISIPKIRPGMTYGSEIRLSVSEVPRNLGQVVDDAGLLGMRVGPVSVPFSGRQGETKAKLVR